jgi:hypothetical protein
MAIEQRNYDPAVMYGAQHNMTVDLGDVLDSNQNEILEFDAVASAVNFIRIANSATGSAVDLTAQGDDTNVGLDVSTKGTGSLTLWSGDGARELLILPNVASAVNEITISSAAASSNPIISATGGDTNIGIALTTKATGAVVITSTGTGGLTVGPAGTTNPTLVVNGNAASAVTGISITAAATGTAVAIAATGSATDESVSVNAKAAGTIAIGNTSTGLVSIATASSAAGMRYKRSVLASSGNTTMTSAMSGSIMLMDSATVAYTLPAIGAGDVGMEFWFTVTTASTASTITAGAADLLTGGVMCMSSAAGIENDQFQPDVTDDLIISMNGTTTGGMIGSTWHLIAISATRWYCDGTTLGSGTILTPFS